MIWPSILLSISGYGWYLIVAHEITGTFPGFGQGLFGLLFLALLPACFGFTLNRSILSEGPTVLKATLIHMCRLFFWVLVTTAAGHILFADIRTLPPGALVFPPVWQLLSWFAGAYLYYYSAEYAPEGFISHTVVAQLSLGLFVTAVFLLTFMGLSFLLPAVLVAAWFVAFTVTLALGTDRPEAGAVRMDIVLFHALVPSLAAVVILFAVFSREIHRLLTTAQRALVAAIMYLLYLLARLFDSPQGNGFEQPAPPPVTGFPDGSGFSLSPSFWGLVPFLLIVLFFLVQAVLSIIRLFGRRMRPAKAVVGRKRSLWGMLGNSWSWLLLLLRSLLKGFGGAVNVIYAAGRRIKEQIKERVEKWLPAKTPDQQVTRSYEALLTYGRKSGYPKKGYETPLEYARRLQETFRGRPFPYEEIERLTGLFLAAKYSGRRAGWPQAAESRQLAFRIKVARK